MNQIAEVKQDKLPRLAFLGVGWIGKNRLQALENSGLSENIGIYDPMEETIAQAIQEIPSVNVYSSYDELLEQDVDGIVIATTSALHANQAIKALEAGKAVFCQKPLGRNHKETTDVVRAAQRANRLLGVDYSYRHTQGIKALKHFLEEGSLGKIYKVEAVFHNAYGPDKDWFYDPNLSGGGCLMDLGSHLIDLILYMFNAPSLEVRYANILSAGKPIVNREEQVEDYAEAHICSSTGVNIRMACSWKMSIGKDADIQFKVYGTNGGIHFHNVNGSFYDFQTEVNRQNSSEILITPPDDWGGRAIQEWAKQLSKDNSFRSANQELIKSASLLEDIYHFNRG